MIACSKDQYEDEQCQACLRGRVWLKKKMLVSCRLHFTPLAKAIQEKVALKLIYIFKLRSINFKIFYS